LCVFALAGSRHWQAGRREQATVVLQVSASRRRRHSGAEGFDEAEAMLADRGSSERTSRDVALLGDHLSSGGSDEVDLNGSQELGLSQVSISESARRGGGGGGGGDGRGSEESVGGGDESESGCLWDLLGAMGRRKTLQAIIDEAQRDNEIAGPKLGLLDLLCVGIGGTVGSGVFVLTGDVLQYAGPSAALSWMLAGLVCLLSAFSYMELSARLPTKGSCYTFSFYSMGELPAVIGAVCLTMEYGLSGAGVARNWSAKLADLIGRSDAGKYMFAYYVNSHDDQGDDDYYFDYSAALLQVVCVVVCVAGLNIGKTVINVFTVSKVLLVLFMIIAGFLASSNDVFESPETFFPEGFGGTLTGTSLLFFGFIGFDEVCCLAAKSVNPRKVMPRAIAGTLIGAAILSMLAQLALASLVRYDDDLGNTSFEEGFKDKGWKVARWITAVGEVTLLPLVVLVSFLPQPELFAAMSEDGLIPAAFHFVNKNGTFVWGNILTGVGMTLFSLCVPFVVLWDMISLGVLLGFNLTNTSLILVRYGHSGNSTNIPILRSAMLLWVFGAIGAYCMWLGCLEPVLNNMDRFSVPATVFGALGLTGSVTTTVWLARRNAQAKEASYEMDTFRAPWVPYVPSMAIVLNFFLMAQFDGLSHAYLGGLVAFMVTVYVVYKSRHPTRFADKEQLIK